MISVTGDWIADARAVYERQPWVSWALAMHVPIAEPMTSIFETADAMARSAGLEALDHLVGVEVRLSQGSAQWRHMMLLVKVLAGSLQRRGIDADKIEAAFAAAYKKRGVDLDAEVAVESAG